MIETAVMIAGGGPVGLTLGLALSRYDLPCIVAERSPATTGFPKMDVTNCRSMELFRRMGVADRLRAAAVPEDHNMDVTWITQMSGHEIHRFHYSSVIEARERIRAQNDGSQPQEPNMRISQVVLEPVLRDILGERRTVTLRYGWAVESFDQDADGVTTTLRETATGAVETVRSATLVGCDGGGSTVRHGLGIGLEGDAGTRARYQIHFRSSDLDVLQRWGIAWHYQSPDYGVMICQDDKEIWTLQAIVPDGVTPDEADPMDLLVRFLGTEIDCEILQANYWLAHLLVAESYGAGRILLAGDSVHQYIPTGGYGMNTGVADAVDLAWKLAALHDGWAGPALLASYEAERRPVGLRNREASRAHTQAKIAMLEFWDQRVHDDGADGARFRAEMAERIAAHGNAENESLGIELGYRYDGSPIVCAEAGTPPALDDLHYRPSTWPGTRAPSLYLDDGRALFDLLGGGFTLIDFAATDTSGLERAAAACGMPLETLRIDDSHARRVYQRDLVLVRPDQHVAWRGDAPPEDAIAVIDRVRGAG